MAENVKNEENNRLVKKVLTIVGNVVFYAVIILLFMFSIMNINQGSKNMGFPHIFGRGFLAVESDSMEHEGVNPLPKYYSDYTIGEIKTYDLVKDKVLKDKDIQNLKVGDVCTFYDENLKHLNTHRIVYITYNDDGSVAIITFQGDKSVMNYGIYDPTNTAAASNNSWLLGRNEIQQFSGDKLSSEYIQGIVTSVKPGTGKVLMNVQKNWLWYFVFPVAVILLVEVFFVVKNLLDLRNEKQRAALAGDKDAMMAELEAEKEKMRQELLAELKAQQAATVSEDTTEVVEEVKEETPVVEETEVVEEAAPVAEEAVVEETTEEKSEE